MPQFFFAFHGGKKPETEEAQKEAMALWGGWMEKYQDKFATRGGPVGKSVTVFEDRVEDNGGANPLSGYCIIEAADMDEAIAIGNDSPVRGGESVEIAPIMEM